MTGLAHRAAKLDKKGGILLAGLQQRHAKLAGQLDELAQQVGAAACRWQCARVAAALCARPAALHGLKGCARTSACVSACFASASGGRCWQLALARSAPPCPRAGLFNTARLHPRPRAARQVADAHIELVCFQALAEQEARAAPDRLERLKALLSGQQEREEVLQAQYKAAVARRDELREQAAAAKQQKQQQEQAEAAAAAAAETG